MRKNLPVIGALTAIGLCLVGGVVLFIIACQRPGASLFREPTVGDLVEHFRRHGLEGKYTSRPAGFMLPGAVEDGSYKGEAFVVYIARFDNLTAAKSLVKTGWNGNACYRNGLIVICIHGGQEKVLPVFTDF